jgi:hypothetical protein
VPVKEFQMANGKEQMANVRPFEFCHLNFAPASRDHLPFEIAQSVCPALNL